MMQDNTEGTSGPEDSVETRREIPISNDRDQLQQDYIAAGGIKNLAATYGISYQRAKKMLVTAGVELQKRGCNGSHHSEAWYAALEKRRLEQGDEIRAQMAAARKVRWADPEQHERASDLLRERWQTDEAWRERHAEGQRQVWADPQAHPLVRQWDDPERRAKQREVWLRRIAATRGKRETPPAEVELHNALMRASVSFTSNAVLLDGLYIVDVLVHQRKLVVEADGVSHNIGDTPDADADREAAIRSDGYEVVRFKYQRLAKDPDGCVASLGLEPEDSPVFDVREHITALHELLRIRNDR